MSASFVLLSACLSLGVGWLIGALSLNGALELHLGSVRVFLYSLW
jgi:hypothetical protein